MPLVPPYEEMRQRGGESKEGEGRKGGGGEIFIIDTLELISRVLEVETASCAPSG